MLSCPKYKLSSLNGASTWNDFCVNRGSCVSPASRARNNAPDRDLWSWFPVEGIFRVVFFTLVHMFSHQTDSLFPHVCSRTVCHLCPLRSRTVAVGFELLDSFSLKPQPLPHLCRFISPILLPSCLHASKVHLGVTLPWLRLVCTLVHARQDTCLAQIAGGVTLRRHRLQWTLLTCPGSGRPASSRQCFSCLGCLKFHLAKLNWQSRALQFYVPLKQSQEHEAAQPRSLCSVLLDKMSWRRPTVMCLLPQPFVVCRSAVKRTNKPCRPSPHPHHLQLCFRSHWWTSEDSCSLLFRVIFPKWFLVHHLLKTYLLPSNDIYCH